jgi:hypothetical protein
MGRALVPKTSSSRFESCHPCQSLKSEHGIAAGASGFQPDDASSTLAARSSYMRAPQRFAAAPSRRVRARQRSLFAHRVCAGVAQWEERGHRKSVIGVRIGVPCKPDVGLLG